MPGKKGGRQWGSTAIATAMVLAAGAIAWFGGAPEGRSTPAAAPTVTMPGQPRDGGTTTVYRSVSQGGLPTRIVVPAAGIDAPVVEVGVVVEEGEARWETAWHAAGHHLDSALPGQAGNVVISGHVSVADPRHAAVFSTLDRVREGDVIEVYAGARVYRYVVERIEVVDPAATEVLRSDARATVTLITCTRDLRHRLVVTGSLMSELAPAGTA